MKVLHVLHELKFSGAEIMYVDAAPLFIQSGCSLTVLSTADNLGEYAPFFERAGYEVLHLPYPKLNKYFNRLSYFKNIINILKKKKFDVVHIHASGTMWGLSLCAWLANKVSIYTFHNVFPSKRYTYIYHFLLRWTAKHIFKCKFQTISDSVFNHELNFYNNITTKIYNWYGNSRFFPASVDEKLNIRRELAIDDDALVLISVGGCSHIKNHHDILRAIQLIKTEFPKCIYLHLGSGITEDEEIQLSKDFGIESMVRFLGNQSNVRKYLIASDIYIMSSKFEGISITTIEAMACCIPSILYDVPGLRDFNNNQKACILIPEDFKELAEKIGFLNKNTQICMDLATSAKKFVDKNFNMQTNVELILKLYKK